VSAVESIEFLKLYAPEGPWDLVAFPIEGGGPKAKRFAPVQADECGAWIEQRAADGHNLYFHVNPNNAPDRKALKTEVTEVRYLHVDLDPHDGEDWDDAQDRMTRLLFEELPSLGDAGKVHKPTFVVDSGNGYWGFWKLDPPIQLDGTKECAEEAECYNRALEMGFDADNCHNVDRVARLPGIDNRPNEKKRNLGRVTRETSLVKHNPEQVFVKQSMPCAPSKAEMNAGSVTISAKGSPVNVSRDDVEVFTGADTKPLEALGLRPETVATILHGWNIIEEPEKPAAHDRSLTVFHISCELERREVPDNVKAGIFLNESWAINEHNFAQKEDTFKYVTRQIERGKDAVATEMAKKESVREAIITSPSSVPAGAVPPDDHEALLAWGNSRYAVIGPFGGKTFVMMMDKEDPLANRMGVRDFKDKLSKQSVFIPAPTENDPLKVKIQRFGDWWMTHPERRDFDGVCFTSDQEKAKGLYNQYRGFAVEPSDEGSCQLYMEHLRDNICGGDEASFEYLVKWMARAVQHPEKPGGAAIVLKGSRGTGKSTFANWFGSLWDPSHYYTASASEQLVGRFTSHLDNKVVVFADEAFFAADRSKLGNLKTMITESHRSSEGKGVNITGLVENHIHLIMASNEDWVVDSGPHERRYLVLELTDDRRQDNAYFEAMRKEMENGGREALLHLLLNIDLTGFDVYNAPKTDALKAQSDQSLTSIEDWWLDKLATGKLLERKTAESWPPLLVFTLLWDDYLSYCKDVRELHPLHKVALGQKLKAFGFPKSRSTRVDGSQVRVYDMPSLQTMRDAWDKEHGGSRAWPEIEDEEVFPPDDGREVF